MQHKSSAKRILEKSVEDYFVERVEALGGVAEKVVALGGRGYFDRVAVLPGPRIIFVEAKKPKGSRISVHQRTRHSVYRALGAEVAVVKTFEDVDRLMTKA